MPFSAYLTLVGQEQGAINGSVTEKGRENSILVHGYDNLITSPRDQTSGLPTGKRVHQPITITKELDRSSVPLWNALVTNEKLTTWELRFWMTNSIDTATQIYTVSLTNAIVTSIHESMSDSVIQPNASGAALQDVTFTYQKIQWTWNDGGLTATDDWLAKA